MCTLVRRAGIYSQHGHAVAPPHAARGKSDEYVHDKPRWAAEMKANFNYCYYEIKRARLRSHTAFLDNKHYQAKSRRRTVNNIAYPRTVTPPPLGGSEQIKDDVASHSLGIGMAPGPLVCLSTVLHRARLTIQSLSQNPTGKNGKKTFLRRTYHSEAYMPTPIAHLHCYRSQYNIFN